MATHARSRAITAALLCAVLAGCAIKPSQQTVTTGPAEVAPFSTGAPGTTLPVHWKPLALSRFKKPTDYRLASSERGTILRAEANGSASALVHALALDPYDFPWLEWEWRVDELIADADNGVPHLEDSPVRMVVAFDGDPSQLDFADRMVFAQAKQITGQDMPFATLMYIWENQKPVGTVIESRHTSRVKMVVADSGKTGLGAWRKKRVNIAEDYRRAFGTKAPKIKYIGLMTDADNTGKRATGYYSDIRFLRRAD